MPSDDASASSGGSRAAATQAQPESPIDPAARVAHVFLDSVLKGDSQRASACLTPVAMQRLIESGKQFVPPGIESATFRIGEVRKPSETQALVQCILAGAPSGGETHSEEMVCLLRQVEGQWRISGIAYNTSPNRPPVILDFESSLGEPMAVPQTPPGPNNSGSTELTDRPSPPRTADEAAMPSHR